MFEKIQKILKDKDKKVENLVVFLIVLIVTLMVINKILDEDKENIDYENKTGIELANEKKVDESINNNDLEKKLESILSKISGVGNVSVLLTYKETSSKIPVYNINSSISSTEEKDSNGISKITETENLQKDVITDNESGIIIDKITMPIVEGAIIIAEGVKDVNVKSNIISAVEAVTGVKNHKIQVFEMGD